MSAQAAATTDPIERLRREQPEALRALQQRAMRGLVEVAVRQIESGTTTLDAQEDAA